MTTAVPSTALVTIQPAFTDPERLALAGFLAGYRGLTREAYALDLRQFTTWCRARSLPLFAVRRADIESFARELKVKGRARATVTRRLCTIAGRGARERIVRTAARLFYQEGVSATGVERLTEQAHVSKRTFYQHFPSKNALVQEYLRRFETDTPLRGVRALERADLAPRERLLAVFAEPPGSSRLRGCPFHNAAVETAGTLPEVEQAVIRHKQAFTRRLIDTAREAGAAHPEPLGRQLAVLFEGATALATTLNDAAPIRDARAAAAALIDAST